MYEETTGTGILLRIQREQEELRRRNFMYKLDPAQAEDYKEHLKSQYVDTIDHEKLKEQIEFWRDYLPQ